MRCNSIQALLQSSPASLLDLARFGQCTVCDGRTMGCNMLSSYTKSCMLLCDAPCVSYVLRSWSLALARIITSRGRLEDCTMEVSIKRPAHSQRKELLTSAIANSLAIGQGVGLKTAVATPSSTYQAETTRRPQCLNLVLEEARETRYRSKTARTKLYHTQSRMISNIGSSSICSFMYQADTRS